VGHGRRGAARLTSGAGRQRVPMGSGGVRKEERRARQRGGEATTGGPSQHSAGRRGLNSVLNRFKNIQTVQMKF
jgi:hypothetical protein